MKPYNKVSYIYIKHLKKWIECPVCHEEMRFNKQKQSWVCNSCNYKILEKDFIDDFVFWFCDGCNAYLNIQDNFNKKETHHVCDLCGFDNNTTTSNIVGICRDCGNHINNPNSTICEDCKIIRLEKAQNKLNELSEMCNQVKELLDHDEDDFDDLDYEIVEVDE